MWGLRNAGDKGDSACQSDLAIFFIGRWGGRLSR